MEATTQNPVKDDSIFSSNVASLSPFAREYAGESEDKKHSGRRNG
jgi:hypothetical protein